MTSLWERIKGYQPAQGIHTSILIRAAMVIIFSQITGRYCFNVLCKSELLTNSA